MQHLIEKRTAYTWIEASLENPDKTDPLFKLCWSQASNINKCLKTNVQKKVIIIIIILTQQSFINQFLKELQ